MALGVHSFYAFPTSNSNAIDRKEDYLLGKFVGDHHNDEGFAAKLQQVQKRIAATIGFPNYSYYWAPASKTNYTPRTAEQKLKTAITKATNKSRKKQKDLAAQNLLFGEAFIQEEQEQLEARIGVLENRYNQTK